MTIVERRRGHPLVVLAMVLTAWVGARVAVWHEAAYAALRHAENWHLAPLGRADAADLPASADAARFAGAHRYETAQYSPWPLLGEAPVGNAIASPQAPPSPPRLAAGAPRTVPAAPGPAAAGAAQGGWSGFFLPPGSPAPATPEAEAKDRLAAAATGQTRFAGPGGNAAPAAPSAPQGIRAPGRWSGDAWLLMRQGGDTLPVASAGVTPATYGANQSGAVLRYALSRSDPHRLAAYGRVTSALDGAVDSEVALGLQGRPIASLPVVALGELRLTRWADGLHARPAALAVTQLPPFLLPLEAQADVYLQGGYVAGPYATAFVDGQIHADRHLARLGKAGELRIGAGSWGGAQKGAARLDIGPEASWRFALGKRKVPARLSVDYRLRIAGNAEPNSGPAMTLATGF